MLPLPAWLRLADNWTLSKRLSVEGTFRLIEVAARSNIFTTHEAPC